MSPRVPEPVREAGAHRDIEAQILGQARGGLPLREAWQHADFAAHAPEAAAFATPRPCPVAALDVQHRSGATDNARAAAQRNPACRPVPMRGAPAQGGRTALMLVACTAPIPFRMARRAVSSFFRPEPDLPPQNLSSKRTRIQKHACAGRRARVGPTALGPRDA